MRVGVSGSGRWWISGGPVFWLLALWIIGPVWLAWHLLLVLVWLVMLACRAGKRGLAALRHRKSPGGGQPR